LHSQTWITLSKAAQEVVEAVEAAGQEAAAEAEAKKEEKKSGSVRFGQAA
jgi:hypothetical protein